MNMSEDYPINELRKILHHELRGELSYIEKKEFLKECIDTRVILNLHEKYLYRKKIVTLAVLAYSVYLAVLLLIFLVNSESAVLTVLITLAIVLIPIIAWSLFSKTVLGYQKFDLVLRIMTKFYVRKK
jgi:hypothetical protein